MVTSLPTMLLNEMINIEVTFIVRFHDPPVCFLYLTSFTLVLQDSSPLLS